MKLTATSLLPFGAALLLSAFVALPESSAYVKRVVKNCAWSESRQQETCNYTYKMVTDEGNVDIWCEGSGTSPCPLQIVKRNPDGTEYVDETEQRLLDYAISQIRSGVLSGQYTDPESGKQVTWTADSPTGDSTIEIQP